MATAEQELERLRGLSSTGLAREKAKRAWTSCSTFGVMKIPSDELYAENVAAIAASIEDFKRGDRGTIAGEHSAQLRRQFGSADK